MNTRLEKLDYLANWPSIWPVSPSTSSCGSVILVDDVENIVKNDKTNLRKFATQLWRCAISGRCIFPILPVFT
jgi:hypothetical protein